MWYSLDSYGRPDVIALVLILCTVAVVLGIWLIIGIDNLNAWNIFVRVMSGSALIGAGVSGWVFTVFYWLVYP